MDAPALLPTDTERSIPYRTVADMQLPKLLPDSVTYTLTHPCVGETILKRQSLFRLLDGAEKRKAASLLADELRRVAKTYSLYRHTRGKVAGLLLLTELEKHYLSAVRLIPSLAGCELTDNLAAYWSDAAHIAAAERLDHAVSEAERHLAFASRFDISFAQDSYLTAASPRVPYVETVRECAKRLGFMSSAQDAHTKMRTHPGGIDVGEAIDAPLSSLFADRLRAAGDALVPVSELEIQALARLSEELAFCLDLLSFIDSARDAGLPICYPAVADKRMYRASGAYDFTLLYKKITDIVPNDIDLSETDGAFFFLVGANGGGKTTYLRTVGGNLLLFLAGSPIFARDAEIYPFSDVRTHFPVDERSSETGRLDDELLRVNSMLDAAGRGSIFLFNETFSGTNDRYGCELAKRTADRMVSENLFGLFVTHFHELEAASDDYGFLEAVIDGENENARTYRIKRRLSRGGSFARDILKKYGLDRESLERKAANT